MANSTPALTTVIVNWNRPTDTLQCIQSVLRAQPSGSQIIVVDNGSDDDSIEAITRAFPQVHLVALPHNLGYSGGFNAGIQAALEGPAGLIFLLNNDTVIAEDSLAHLAQTDWDIAVPKILYFDDPQRIWAAGARWRRFPPSVIMSGYRRLDGPQYDQARPLDYATGCALLLKRKALETLGGFDPQYSNYMEDYDLCWRARQAGLRLGYVPQARILHKVSLTLGAFSPARWRFQGRNLVLFYRKNNRFPPWMLWTFLAWFTLRETINGQAPLLPHFWRGVQEGRRALQAESAQV